MKCGTCAIVCGILLASVYVGDSCDSTALQACYTDYISGVAGLSGTAACDHINDMVTCISDSCAGCNDAAIASFQSTVDGVVPAMCTNSGATCPGHAICNNTMSCDSGTVNANVASKSSLSFAALAVMGCALLKF